MGQLYPYTAKENQATYECFYMEIERLGNISDLPNH